LFIFIGCVGICFSENSVVLRKEIILILKMQKEVGIICIITTKYLE
jgi:hypothetical protein